MTVIQFPKGRFSPAPPIDEQLTALELELLRARLAQVRAETRQANALWLSYCLKRVLLWGLLLWVLTAFAGAAEIRTQLFDEAGNHVGISTESGNKTTIHYDDGTMATDELYKLDGKVVSVFTDAQGIVEIRPVAKPASNTAGGLMFNSDGQRQEDGALVGDARLDRPGCREWFSASLARAKDGGLTIWPMNYYRSKQMKKCKAVFRPAR